VLTPSGELEGAKVKRWIQPDVERLRHQREVAQRARAFSPFGYLKPAPRESIAVHFKSASAGDAAGARIAPLGDRAAKPLVVTACLEDEAAIASTSQTNGLSAFTQCLLTSMRGLGPNRSTVEVLQAAGHELRRLGVRQTPIVKEPVEPEHLGLRSFLTFQPVLFVYSPAAPGAEQEGEISRSVAEAIQHTLTILKEGRPMQTQTAGAQTLMGDDIGTIANTVTPIVAALLQGRGYQPYSGFGLPYSGFGPFMGGGGFQLPLGPCRDRPVAGRRADRERCHAGRGVARSEPSVPDRLHDAAGRLSGAATVLGGRR
jgi:hypothetical protein